MAISYFASDNFKNTLLFCKRLRQGDRQAQQLFVSHAKYAATSIADSKKAEDLLKELSYITYRQEYIFSEITDSGTPIYRIGRELYKVLEATKSEDVLEYLKKIKRGTYIIELPENNNLVVKNIKSFVVDVREEGTEVLIIDGVGPVPGAIYIKQGDDYWSKPESDFGTLAKTVMNILTYINYGSEDIVKQDNEYRISSDRPTVPKHLRHKFEFNSIMVGFNYKKQFKFKVDGCTVSGHFRWQPHGPGRSKLKLIYIHPFEKQFNKQENSNE